MTKCDIRKNQNFTRCTALETLENMEEVIITPQQAGSAIGISPQAIRVMARENKLPFPYMLTGSRVYIPRLPLIKYLKGESFVESASM